MIMAYLPRPSGHVALLILLTAFAVQMLVVNALPVATQAELLAEGGFYETLSVIFYFVCVAALVWRLRGNVLQVWYLPLILTIMAARELDLDKSQFTRGLFKARQYTGSDVPLGERIVAGLILALIVYAIVLMLRRHTRPYLSALLENHAWAGAVLLGVGFTLIYKLLDGIARKLTPLGIEISESAVRTAFVIEEIGELGIPIMFLTAIKLRPGALPNAAHLTNRTHCV